MKDYFKGFDNQYDINPIIDYLVRDNGIYIRYIDNEIEFEEIMKLQDFILFDKVYGQDYLSLLWELETGYKLLRTKVKYPIICRHFFSFDG